MRRSHLAPERKGPAKALDDGQADRQSQAAAPAAVRTAGPERHQNLRPIALGDAGAGIGNLENDLVPTHRARHHDHRRMIHAFPHGVDRVQHEVEDENPHVAVSGQHPRHTAHLPDKPHATALRLKREERQGVANDLGQVDEFGSRLRERGKAQQTVGDPLAIGDLGLGNRDILARGLGLARLAPDRLQGETDRGKGIVHLVRNAGSQHADLREPLLLRKIHLPLQVAHRLPHAGDGAVRAGYRGLPGMDLDRQLAAVAAAVDMADLHLDPVPMQHLGHRAAYQRRHAGGFTAVAAGIARTTSHGLRGQTGLLAERTVGNQRAEIAVDHADAVRNCIDHLLQESA